MTTQKETKSHRTAAAADLQCMCRKGGTHTSINASVATRADEDASRVTCCHPATTIASTLVDNELWQICGTTAQTIGCTGDHVLFMCTFRGPVFARPRASNRRRRFAYAQTR